MSEASFVDVRVLTYGAHGDTYSFPAGRWGRACVPA